VKVLKGEVTVERYESLKEESHKQSERRALQEEEDERHQNDLEEHLCSKEYFKLCNAPGVVK
jgi:hypothetical protein